MHFRTFRVSLDVACTEHLLLIDGIDCERVYNSWRCDVSEQNVNGWFSFREKYRITIKNTDPKKKNTLKNELSFFIYLFIFFCSIMRFTRSIWKISQSYVLKVFEWCLIVYRQYLRVKFLIYISKEFFCFFTTISNRCWERETKWNFV